MPTYRESRHLPYSVDQMFAVVADVERYPEFLPGCAGLNLHARETEDDVEHLTAEMLVAYRGLQERYTSCVTLDRGVGTIAARHVDGPFHHLDTCWRFTPDSNGCTVEFDIDFAFKSRLLSTMSGLVLDLMARKMTDAFVARADMLYGGSQQPEQ